VAPGPNCLDALSKGGVEVLSVGKIEDLFCFRSIDTGNHTGNNRDGLNATLDFMKRMRNKRSFIFTNLVDTDSLFGHRRDPVGYAKSLSDFDAFLPKLLSELKEDEAIILTGDHGCDPTFKGTDHTREYVPMVLYQPGLPGKYLGDRGSFADVGATLLEGFGVSNYDLPDLGNSFLCT